MRMNEPKLYLASHKLYIFPALQLPISQRKRCLVLQELALRDEAIGLRPGSISVDRGKCRLIVALL